MVEALKRRIDIPRSREILPQALENSARALIVRLNHPADVLTGLIPSQTDISHGLKKPEIGKPESLPQNFFLTHSCLILKGTESPAAGQIQLVGGRRKTITQRDHTKRKETVQETVGRETREEIHLSGLDPSNMRILVDKRKYSFIHPDYETERTGGKKMKMKVIRHDAILSSFAPSFIDPYAYDPKDKVKQVLKLTPAQIEELFTSERIFIPETGLAQIHLTDSLSENEVIRRRQRVDTFGGDLKAIKEKIISEAYRSEAEMRIRLIDRLLEISSAEDLKKPDSYLRRRWQNLKTTLNPTVENQIPALKDFIASSTLFLFTITDYLNTNDVIDSDVDGFLSDYNIALNPQDLDSITLTNLKKRIKLGKEIKTVMQSLTFEYNLQFIKDSGPQQAFLLIQNFLQLDQFTAYEYKLLDQCPEVRTIFGVLSEVFGVNTKNHKDWLGAIKSKMAEYRDKKRRVIRNDASESDKQEVEKLQLRLSAEFAHKLLKERRTGHVSKHLNEAVKFGNYVDGAIKTTAPPHVRAQISYSPTTLSEYLLDELFLTAFNIGYSEDEAVSDEQSWIAWRTILLSIRVAQAEKIDQENTQLLSHDFYGDIFRRLTKVKIGEEFSSPERERIYIRWKLLFPNFPPRITIPHPISGKNIDLDLSDIDIEILTYFRLKTKESILRKLMERGEEEGIDIDDLLGRYFVIDMDKIINSLANKYPLQVSLSRYEIEKSIARFIAMHILHFYADSTTNSGYTSYTDKTREYGTFEQLLNPVEHYQGSGASRVLWKDWLKYVHRVKENEDENSPILYREEHQHLLVSGLRQKELDDEAYNTRRLFEYHKDRYYPLALVLYQQMSGAYHELVLSQYQTGPVYSRGGNRIGKIRIPWLRNKLTHDLTVGVFK